MQKGLNRFFVPPVQKVRVAVVRDSPSCIGSKLGRQIKAVNRGKKEERADAMVQIGTVVPESFKGLAFRQKLCDGSVAAKRLDRCIPELLILGSDDRDKSAHQGRGSRGRS